MGERQCSRDEIVIGRCPLREYIHQGRDPGRRCPSVPRRDEAAVSLSHYGECGWTGRRPVQDWRSAVGSPPRPPFGLGHLILGGGRPGAAWLVQGAGGSRYGTVFKGLLAPAHH